MNEEQIEEIRKRAEAVARGEWYVGVDGSVNDRRDDFNWKIAEVKEKSDAEFIAHAREDIPALLAEVERLREEVRYLEEDVERWRDLCEHADRMCDE